MKYKECVDGLPDHCWHWYRRPVVMCCMCHKNEVDMRLAETIDGRKLIVLPYDASRKAANAPRIDAKSSGGTAGRLESP